jgi:hypothetical protein
MPLQPAGGTDVVPMIQLVPDRVADAPLAFERHTLGGHGLMLAAGSWAMPGRSCAISAPEVTRHV